MNPNQSFVPDILSESYRVLPAVQVDFDALFALYRSNASYFSYFSMEPTEERLRRDMTMLPDGCAPGQKHFLVYLDGDVPIALIDLIAGYPDATACYIGLFMVHADRTRRGVGTRIIHELCSTLASLGYENVRLAYGKHYEWAKSFWTKNGFSPLREGFLDEYGELIVAQRPCKMVP